MFLLVTLAVTPACAADGSPSTDINGTGFGETGGATTGTGGDGDGDADASDSTDTGLGDGDGAPSDPGCGGACGAGECIIIGLESYCDCLEGTEWNGSSCDPCPKVTDFANHPLELDIIEFSGRFLIDGHTPPNNDYDDANIWLENQHTGDRVWLGNTHNWVFSARVTPGVYDVYYEVETAGLTLPRNARVSLGKRVLFGDAQTGVVIDIPVARVGGSISVDGETPPDHDYDDANIMLRLAALSEDSIEIPAGNTHDGMYGVNVVPGTYEIVYRNETPNTIMPRNVGAVVGTVELFEDADPVDHPLELLTVAIDGAYFIDNNEAPANDYNDANIELVSSELGTVQLGNTHDVNYSMPVLGGSYDIIYRHESGADVPQNLYGYVATVDMNDGGTFDIEIPMVTISGAMTINGVQAPNSEFDDGVLHLRGVDSQDQVLLGNTHDVSYQVNVLPGSYHVHYAQETSGGTVPDNNDARVLSNLALAASDVVNIDISAVALSGSFTIAGQTPPISVYDNGRVYLRNTETHDSVLLGSTHQSSYSAIVVPGNYDVFYVQEVGGEVPGNQNALLENLWIDIATVKDFDISKRGLAGTLLVMDSPAPNTPSDGGQLYLRTSTGDSVLLGDSFAPGFAANLVAGTYGVYYRAEGSVTMPQNPNGRFACITVE